MERGRETLRRDVRPARQTMVTPQGGAEVWQRTLTLKCDQNLADDGVEIIQPAAFWKQTDSLSGVLVRSEIARIDANCHVYLETAATLNGPWNEAADLTSAGTTETMLSANSPSDPLTGFLRWRVVFTGTTGTDWTVCFKLTIYPNAGIQPKLQLTPRVA
jgi:hypothetical protein